MKFRRDKHNTNAHNPSDTALSTCERKRSFHSEKDALAAAEEQMSYHLTLELGVYQCLLCGGWHLTQLNISDDT